MQGSACKAGEGPWLQPCKLAGSLLPCQCCGSLACAEAWRWVTGQPEQREEAGGCCRYWALTWVSPREVLSFGQRARGKCARKVTETTEFVIWKCIHPEKAGVSLGKRGKAHTVELDAVATSQF